MFVRDHAALRSPARRLNALVVISNVWFVLFFAIALVLLALHLLTPELGARLFPAVQPFIAAAVLLAIPAWGAWFAIRMGLIKCPCCGDRFANPKFGYSLSRKCENCGFDVRTLSRQGDF